MDYGVLDLNSVTVLSHVGWLTGSASLVAFDSISYGPFRAKKVKR
jgi:hypothetical protein